MIINKLATWGQVQAPPGVANWGAGVIGTGSGLQKFLSACIKTLIVFAGVYAFLNIIFAGFSFMSAGGNPEKIAQSWAKIYQSLLGLLIAAGSFVLAAIFGRLIFGDWNALLQLKIFTPVS